MGYKIPLFKLNFDEKEAQAAFDTINSGWISTGPNMQCLLPIARARCIWRACCADLAPATRCCVRR